MKEYCDNCKKEFAPELNKYPNYGKKLKEK